MQAFSDKKSVFNVIYAAVFHFDHVETAFPVLVSRPLQVRPRNESVFFALFRVHRLRGFAERIALPALYLYEHQRFAVERDDVDLPRLYGEVLF